MEIELFAVAMIAVLVEIITADVPVTVVVPISDGNVVSVKHLLTSAITKI